MASTLQPVSIPVSLTVIGLIWAAEGLQMEPGNTAIQTHEITEHGDSQIPTTDVEDRQSKLKSPESSTGKSPKEE